MSVEGDSAVNGSARIERFDVPFDDIDAGGVLYNANYLKYCDRARNTIFSASGWSWTRMIEQKQVMAVIAVEAEYRRAVRQGPIWVATCFETRSDKFLEASHVFITGEMSGSQVHAHILAHKGSWMKMRGVHFRAHFKLAPISPGDFAPASLDPAFIEAINS
jgi:YbgC/YbaW family acyl-CoA thioester hydrolase